MLPETIGQAADHGQGAPDHAGADVADEGQHPGLDPVQVHRPVIAADGPGALVLEALEHPLDGVPGEDAVRVDEHQDLAGGVADAQIQGGPLAGVGLCQDRDPRIRRRRVPRISSAVLSVEPSSTRITSYRSYRVSWIERTQFSMTVASLKAGHDDRHAGPFVAAAWALARRRRRAARSSNQTESGSTSSFTSPNTRIGRPSTRSRRLGPGEG